MVKRTASKLKKSKLKKVKTKRLRRRLRTMRHRGLGSRGGKRAKENVNININVTVEPEKRRGLKRRSLRAIKTVRIGGGPNSVSSREKTEGVKEFMVSNREEGTETAVKSSEVSGGASILKECNKEKEESSKSGRMEIKIIKNVSGERGVEEPKLETEMRRSNEDCATPQKSEAPFENQAKKVLENSEISTNNEIKDEASSLKLKTETPSLSDTTKENKTLFLKNTSLKIHELSRDTRSESDSIFKEEKPCTTEEPSKMNKTPFILKHDCVNPESSKVKNKDKKRKLCKKGSNCKSDNKSIFAEDCDFCSKIDNGKNKSNSTEKNRSRKSEGLKDENLFGTPKTKYRKH